MRRGEVSFFAQVGLATVVLALLCALGTRVLGAEAACSAAGGRLETSGRWLATVCVREGKVVQP